MDNKDQKGINKSNSIEKDIEDIKIRINEEIDPKKI